MRTWRGWLLIVILILVASCNPPSAQAATHSETWCKRVTPGVNVCMTYRSSPTPKGINGDRLVLSSNHCGSIRRFYAIGVQQRSRTYDQRVLPNGGCRYSHAVKVWTKGQRARVEVDIGLSLKGIRSSYRLGWVLHVCRDGGC